MCRTLIEALEARRDGNKGVTFISGTDKEKFVSYKDLYDSAARILYNLQHRGLKRRDFLILQLDDNEMFLKVFWACLLGGIIPVPVALGINTEYRMKLVRIWHILDGAYVIADGKFDQAATELGGQDAIKSSIIKIEEICDAVGTGRVYRPQPDDTAYIQFSSGSTGDPKGVILTHENLMININSMILRMECTPSESGISWLPLTHDMGMIGGHLLTTVMGMNLYLIPTSVFIRNPILWMKKANEYRINYTCSPNFGYHYFLKQLKPEACEGWDLSCIRLIFNGAEPIELRLVQNFLNTMGKYGLKKSVMFNVYGLAEATLAVTFPHVGDGLSAVSVDRRLLHIGREVIFLEDGDSSPNALALLDLGDTVKDCAIRICGGNNNVLAENIVGNIQIKGKNVTKGYYNNEQATSDVILEGGWLNTGDLGFTRNGRLYVTGRAKDMIILNGQNFYLHDIERVAVETGVISLGEVAACSTYNSEICREEVNLYVIYKKKLESFIELSKKLEEGITNRIGISINKVIPIKKIPKTTSGKIQRYKLSEKYKNGEFDAVIMELEQLRENTAGRKTGDIGITETERVILEICRSVLGNKTIGVNDRLVEYGVNSLHVIQIHGKIEEVFPGKLNLPDLYSFSSVAEIAKHIDNEGTCSRKAGISHETGEFSDRDIAIIGISVKLPLADSLEEFWEVINSGIDLTRELPASRKEDIDKCLGSAAVGIKYCEGAYLDRIDQFDYSFFRIPPKEAKLMDPNQRLFLQTAWKAVEDAGYGASKLAASNTGVFVGFANYVSNSYGKIICDSGLSEATAKIGNLAALMPARISFHMNLKGPSMVIDTACSSSLVSVAQACQSIQSGQCDMALAGGVKINLVPTDNEDGKIGFESSDGRTRAFDDKSDGTGIGEGIGVVVLKPLKKAIKDGDKIHAVIKGFAVNQDGSSIGITAPNPAAQTEVIAKAWEDAGIDPETVTYIETHGTGTNLGDPIEIKGIHDAFRKFTGKTQFCGISSCKTNIGHLYEAAGIASLIKAVMALEKKKIPASVYFNRPNRQIDFVNSPIYINTITRDWTADKNLRRCGVSSFGIGGTNCHIILEEAPAIKKRSGRVPGQDVLALSAGSDYGVKFLISRYIETLEKNKDKEIWDIAYTANTGRGHYNYRLAVTFRNREELLERLKKALADKYDGEGIYYGHFKVISEDRAKYESFEITEDERLALDKKARLGMERFLEQGDMETLESICRLYISGAHIDWDVMYKNEERFRLSLPVYPFENNRCWFDIPEDKKVISLVDRHDRFYTVGWQMEKLCPLHNKHENGSVLVFQGEGALSREIADRYITEGRDVIEVKIGGVFEEVNKNRYVISGNEEDYCKLMLLIKDRNICKILHMMTLDNDDCIETLGKLEESQQKGVMSFFYLTRAIVKAGIDQEMDVVLISDYVTQVNGFEEKIKPENMTLFGMGKVVRKEHHNILCRCIDVDDNTKVQDVFAELEAGSLWFNVAYRRGVRYVEEFKEIDIDVAQDRKLGIKEGGIYVITGGAGGIGMEVAKYLASQNKVTIALINRSPMPDRQNWESILANGEDENLIKKIKDIQEIEATGAKIECYSANVSNSGEMSKVLHDIRAKHGKINGVIHGAGVGGIEPIVSRRPEDFNRVFYPKVYGTWILDRLTREDELDFFIMFSSIATILSAPGQGDYTAANAYLDSFSHYRNMTGKRTITINWSIWRETGMCLTHDFSFDTVFKGLLTKEYIGCFDKMVNKDIPKALIGEINYSDSMVFLLEKYMIKLSDKIRKELDRRRGEAKKKIKSEKTDFTGEVRLTGKGDNNYSELEILIGRVWGKVLGFNEINIYDNFFELGGDSISGLKIANMIEKETGKKINIADVLTSVTISSFVKRLEDMESDKKYMSESIYAGINPTGKLEFYPASLAQKRLYILHEMEGANINYNVSKAVLIEGNLDIVRFEDAFKSLVKRQEALRTGLKTVDGEIVQYIKEDVEFRTKLIEISEDMVNKEIQKFIKPFDLSKMPLFRTLLMKIADRKYLLLLDIHHTITDGVSMDILIEEFAALYEGKKLDELRIQYRDYAAHQKIMLASDKIKKQEEYWLGLFKDEIPVLNLPTDYPRPPAKSYEGATLSIELDSILAGKLYDLAKETGTTLYMVLLSAFHVLLHKYSGQEDIIIGTPVVGRTEAELERIHGMFVNTLVLRNRPYRDKTFREFLLDVKNTTLAAYENQDFELGELIGNLNVHRDLSRNPLFDVMFELLNVGTRDICIEELRISYYKFEEKTALFDLLLEVIEKSRQLSVLLNYCTALYKKETAERILDDYVGLLGTVCGSLDTVIGKISLQSVRNFERAAIRNINVDFEF